MKIRLISDFIDVYDPWFDQNPNLPIFRRVVKDGIGRPAQLSLMALFGLPVPPHGPVWALADCRCSHLVLYKDVHAHWGEGMILLPKDEALIKWPEFYASGYIEPTEGKAVSYRYISIGGVEFWLKCRSTDAWRSNCGRVDVQLLFREEWPKLTFEIPQFAPLFALDFVLSDSGLVAVDYDSAPLIRGTGIEKYMRPEAIAAAIKDAFIRSLDAF